MKDRLTWERIPYYGQVRSILEVRSARKRGEEHYTDDAEHRNLRYHGIVNLVTSVAITVGIVYRSNPKILESLF